MCAAPMNRIQFSWSRNRPAAFGCAARQQDRAERGERDAGDEERDPGGARLQQRRVDHEAEEAEHGQREEAAEPLERDRGERGLARADVLRRRG